MIDLHKIHFRFNFDDLLLKKILKKLNVFWTCQLKPVQMLTLDVLKTLKESGMTQIMWGVESANDTVLGNMNKKAKRSDFLRGIEYLKKYGITTMAAFVLGFPGETDETIMDNLSFIDDSNVDNSRIISLVLRFL